MVMMMFTALLEQAYLCSNIPTEWVVVVAVCHIGGGGAYMRIVYY